MKIRDIEPIRITPFISSDPRAVAGTSYISGGVMRRDDKTQVGPVAEYTILLPTQTHGTKVTWVGEEDLARVKPGMSFAETRKLFPDTDGLLTKLRGVAIGVRAADCLPIVMYARDIQAVGAVHAGWRGTHSMIAGKAVRMLIEAGADPSEILVRFAPCICGLCYEVGEELAEKFVDAGLGDAVSRICKRDPLNGEPWAELKPHIDLVKANRIILAREGIPAANFFQSDLCTRHTSITLASPKEVATHYVYHSWRRSCGTTRRNTSFVLLIPK